MLQRAGESGPLVELTGSVTFDAASCGAAAVTIQTVPIPGCAPGDGIQLWPPVGGLSVAVAIGMGWCETAGSARVPFINPTAGALDPASAIYGFAIIKR